MDQSEERSLDQSPDQSIQHILGQEHERTTTSSLVKPVFWPASSEATRQSSGDVQLKGRSQLQAERLRDIVVDKLFEDKNANEFGN